MTTLTWPSVCEIACDESGSDGENLIATTSRVFAHASTDLTSAEADKVIETLRIATKFRGDELKSPVVLARGADIFVEMLKPGGLLHGRARVAVTDKTYFAVSKAIDLIIEEAAYDQGMYLHNDGSARAMARTLFRDGPRAMPAGDFDRLIGQFVSFIRAQQRRGTKATMEDLLATIDELRLRARRRSVRDILQMLWKCRDYLRAFVDGGSYSQPLVPTLDPVIPSLHSALVAWHEVHRRPIRVVHDRYSGLTPAVVQQIVHIANHPHPDFPYRVPLTEIALVDSRADARVRVADVVAGWSRVVGTDALVGEIDSELASIFGSLVLPGSLWGDEQSWQRLTGRSGLA